MSKSAEEYLVNHTLIELSCAVNNLTWSKKPTEEQVKLALEQIQSAVNCLNGIKRLMENEK